MGILLCQYNWSSLSPFEGLSWSWLQTSIEISIDARCYCSRGWGRWIQDFQFVHNYVRSLLKVNFSFFAALLRILLHWSLQVLITSKLRLEPNFGSIFQNLNESIFTNFQNLHAALQIFILKCIRTFYSSKKEIRDDVSFYLCMSVSTLLLFPF